MTPKPVETTFLSSATDAWGAEESLLSLAPRLLARGVAPILKTANPALADRWCEAVGTPFEVIPSAQGSRMRAAISWSKQVPSGAQDACVFFNIDLIPSAVITRVTRRQRAALILDLHDYLPSRSGRLKVRFGARSFDSVVSVSNFSAGQISHRSNTVLTRPVDGAPPTQDREISDSRAIAVVGRIDPDKNLEMVIDAALLLPDDITLVVRGESTANHGEYRTSLLTRAEQRLGARLHFEGRVPRNDALDGVDVLIVSNAAEALGRTVLEAQLAGVPVVVPNRGGAAELVVAGETGFTFQAGDTQSLVVAISRALSAPAELIERARHEAATRTDPDAYAEAYARVIRKSVG